MTTATPEDPTLLVHAYLDGELDPAHVLEIERRLVSEPALAAERDRVEALRRVIHERLPREAPPPGLARRIEAAIGGAPSRPSSQPSWRALAASVVLGMFVASGATWFALRPGAEATANLVVASHMRSLMASQPTDVVSSDRHTVKPWFNGRVAEAPRVADLASEGFSLVGARIDVIGRAPVPTLVYRLRRHLISLSAVPAGHDAVIAAGRRTVAGYNTFSWTDNGVTYWAVSDVAAADLDKFAKAFRDANP
jgi:anti-sigma factor RsiW